MEGTPFIGIHAGETDRVRQFDAETGFGRVSDPLS